MKKLIVWDLFGGGQNSVFNAINEDKYLKDKFEIYTWDITEPTRNNHYKLDLASDNIVQLFWKYPRPDIIVASPLCQSFSCVLAMKGGGTPFWKLNETKDYVLERSVEEFERLKGGFTKNLKADVQLFIKRLGEKCLNNTIELIKFYKPKYFYIENPKQSMMWKYIQFNRKDFHNENHYFNEASYGKYGFLTTKATYFYSNLKLILKKGRIDPPYTIQEINGEKYYVLKDDHNIKLRRDLDSRMLGLASLNRMIKARKVKSGMGAMDFVQRYKTPVQKNKMVNEQICEAGPASAIPHSLIIDIFNQILNDVETKE
ncbi:hypothetical protein ACXYRO_01895 [Mycoplasma sp. 4013]